MLHSIDDSFNSNQMPPEPKGADEQALTATGSAWLSKAKDNSEAAAEQG